MSVATLPRLTLVVGLLLLGFALPSTAQDPSGLQAAAAIEAAMVNSIARAEKSVVAIARVRRDNRPLVFEDGRFGAPKTPDDPGFVPNEYGTGVVIDRDGLIVTAYHILGEDSDHWVTTVDRRSHRATVVGADPRSDLAVLKIDASNLTPISFGDARQLKKGQIVIALGNPYAIARDGQVSASWGIIANLQRKSVQGGDVKSSGDELHRYGTLIQTDAKLNLGTSGGALLNLRGEMIGMTTALAASAGYEQAAGYAIPVDETFRRAVDTLKEGREVEYGFLGIEPRTLEPTDVQRGLQGIRVSSVVPGTPADRAGIRPQDVITHVNDQPLHDQDSLFLEVGRLPAEASAKLAVLRGKQRLALDVNLMKASLKGRKIVTAQRPNWRGLQVDFATVTPDHRNLVARGDVDPQGCVLITAVEMDSPAAAAELKAGEFIRRVGKSRVNSPSEFYAAVAALSGPVQLEVTQPAPGQLRTVAAESD